MPFPWTFASCRLVFASVLKVGGDAKLVTRDGLPKAPKDEQRPQPAKNPRCCFFFGRATQDLLLEEIESAGLQHTFSPDTRDILGNDFEDTASILSVLCVRSQVRGSPPSISSPDGFRNLCVTWRGKSACNCCEMVFCGPCTVRCLSVACTFWLKFPR